MPRVLVPRSGSQDGKIDEDVCIAAFPEIKFGSEFVHEVTQFTDGSAPGVTLQTRPGARQVGSSGMFKLDRFCLEGFEV